MSDHLLPAVDPLPLPAQLLLLVLTLLPLFVGDAGHDALVGLGLALALLEVALFLVHILLLDLLVLLLEQALFEPLFKQAIGCLLLSLFLKPLELFLPPLFMLLVLLILALPLLPVSHLCQLFLSSHLLLSLDSPDLLEDVDLGLLDQLLLQFDLVLLPPTPLFMREGVVCAVTDLRTLLEDA